MIRYLCIGLIALSGCDAPISQTAPDPKPVKVVFMGDSITRFWTELETLVPGSVNLGVGGNNTAQMAARFDEALTYKPTAVVITGGINDLAWSDYADTRYIADMALRASYTGARVYIGNVMPVPDELPQVTPERLSAFNNELRVLCLTYGYTYVDFYSATQVNGKQKAELFFDTSVHPTPEGYAVMWSVLRPLLSN